MKIEEFDLIGWVMFFLDAVSETAKTGCEKFKRIFALRDDMQVQISKMPNVALAQSAIRALYSEPRITINRLAELLGCDYQTANRLVRRFEANKIVVCSTDTKRNAIYDFKRYLDIFKD